jgi:hypothetical protein
VGIRRSWSADGPVWEWMANPASDARMRRGETMWCTRVWYAAEVQGGGIDHVVTVTSALQS